MTQLLQSGQHPDADQLNAFVEHALPFHEQQEMLAHLGVCPKCREIAHLAQPMVAEESVTAVRPVAARRLFFGWKLALPAGLTVALLVALSVHLINVGTDNNPRGVDKLARMEQSQTTAPTTQAVPSNSIPAPIGEVPTSAIPPSGVLTSSPAQNSVPVPPGRKLSSLNGYLVSREGVAPPTLNQTAVSSAGLASEANQPVAGAGSRSASLPPAPAAASVPASQSAAMSNVDAAHRELRSSATQYNSTSVAPQSKLDQAFQVAPPPAPPPQAPPAVNETVTVTNAPAMLETESDASSEVITGRAIGELAVPLSKMKKQPSLPSNLRAASTVSNGQQEIAIDTAGSLFRSQDAGVSWQSVPVQWSGRAVKLQIAPITGTSSLGTGANTATAASTTKGLPKATVQSTFELTNEAGTVWTSKDGDTWTRK